MISLYITFCIRVLLPCPLFPTLQSFLLCRALCTAAVRARRGGAAAAWCRPPSGPELLSGSSAAAHTAPLPVSLGWVPIARFRMEECMGMKRCRDTPLAVSAWGAWVDRSPWGE